MATPPGSQPSLQSVSQLDSRTQHQSAAKSADHKSLQAQPASKSLPVLPWMRVPIGIEGGAGVPLCQVVGLHPLALAALQTGIHSGYRTAYRMTADLL